ncbi:MAG: GxxExxY protein [Gammaproteobacteria bacterium]|jgi:GxxExxY protein
MDENEISKQVIAAAIEVHRNLGPGLLESVYQQCMQFELDALGLPCETEVPVSAIYKGKVFDSAFRMDMLVAGKVVIELKVVDRVLPVHEAQLLSYLRLTDKKLGLLINFHAPRVKDGLKRIVNNL